MSYSINWWRTSFGEEEILRVVHSLRNEHVSQGKVTEEFEHKLGDFLGVEHVVATTSGTSALTLAYMTLGVRPGDEVIVPNRTWVATAHAALILGAKVVLIDVELNRPVINAQLIEEAITSHTKVIVPVHMNGRSADMKKIRQIASKHDVFIVEDAAQAIASRNSEGFLGTQSDIGCFSLSVAKTVATGQGGFAVTNNTEVASRMKNLRTHGVESVKDLSSWNLAGFNFRFTDLQASIGIEQLQRLPYRVNHLKELYQIYSEGLKDSPFTLIPVDLENGEVPVYNEFLVENRTEWIAYLADHSIDTRPFYPDLDTADYIPQLHSHFPNSRKYGKQGIYLPSGPTQELKNAKVCVDQIMKK